MSVRPLRPDDRPWVERFLREMWGSDVVVAHGEVFKPADLPGFLAEVDGEPVGLAHVNVVGEACEVVTIGSVRRGEGVGSALIQAVAAEAARRRCRRLWLVTTNDNLDALRFYQRRGFRLVAVHPGAVDRARALKPEMPFTGDHGIPIRDELELERTLD